MKIFLAGGSKSGKSSLAQRLAKKLACDRLFYIATMSPHDQEDYIRITNHIKDREGMGFVTLEQPIRICECLKTVSYDDTFLLDSITSLLANEMFSGSHPDFDAYERIIHDTKLLCDGAANAVIVSDYIFSDAICYDKITESYKKSLGLINRSIASASDVVIEMVFGNAICRKGELFFDRINKKAV